MAFTENDFNNIWASTSPLTPYEFTEENYKSGWDFIGSTPPSRQMWDFLQKQNDEKSKWLYDNKLSLSGGTMTGNILSAETGLWIQNVKADNSGSVFLVSAQVTSNGAYLRINGSASSNGGGHFNITASDGSNSTTLNGRPDGTLTWAGKNVLTDATVGTIVSNTSSAISVGSTSKAVVSISLSAGVWVVTGTISYESIVSGRQFAGLNTTTTMNANIEGTVIHSSNAASSATLALTTTRIFSLSATTTVNLNGYVNGGTVDTGTNTIRAVRIK